MLEKLFQNYGQRIFSLSDGVAICKRVTAGGKRFLWIRPER